MCIRDRVCITAGEAIRSRTALTKMNCFIKSNLSLDQQLAVERPHSEHSCSAFITKARAPRFFVLNAHRSKLAATFDLERPMHKSHLGAILWICFNSAL